MTHQSCNENTKRGNAYILQKDFENTTGLLVDETRDTLDTATAGQTTNGRFGNT